jgi:hypothetical protein
MIRYFSGLIAILALMPAARAQEYVVIESSVAALASGTKISSGTALDIPAQGRVVLLASNGQVQAVQGPYQGPPPAAPGSGGGGASGMINVVAALATASNARQEVGVARAIDWRADALKSPDDALAIDVSDGGDICVFDPAHASVIHDPSAAGTMDVQSMGDGSQATLTWPKGTLQQPWPVALKMNDGDMFSFAQKGADQAAMATIHVLTAPPGATDVEHAVLMAQAGCQDQAKRLLAIVAKTAK